MLTACMKKGRAGGLHVTLQLTWPLLSGQGMRLCTPNELLYTRDVCNDDDKNTWTSQICSGYGDGGRGRRGRNGCACARGCGYSWGACNCLACV